MCFKKIWSLICRVHHIDKHCLGRSWVPIGSPQKQIRNTPKVASLNQHVNTVEKEYREIEKFMAIPLSELNPDEVMACIDSSKGRLKHVDQDLRDARRRINAAKGPRPKAKAKAAAAAAESDSDEDCSEAA